MNWTDAKHDSQQYCFRQIKTAGWQTGLKCRGGIYTNSRCCKHKTDGKHAGKAYRGPRVDTAMGSTNDEKTNQKSSVYFACMPNAYIWATYAHHNSPLTGKRGRDILTIKTGAVRFGTVLNIYNCMSSKITRVTNMISPRAFNGQSLFTVASKQAIKSHNALYINK